MDFAAIFTIASQEARINIRNRWTVLFAGVFGLLALAISYFGLVTEGYAGFQGFEQPVARHEILLGKVAGLIGSMLTAMLFGFGVAGTVIASQVGTDGLLRFLSFTVIALLLALSFLSLGSLVAVLGVTRARAFGLALFVWFFLVLFYDLLVMGAGFLLKERAANMLIFLSLFGNPVDAARVAGLISVGDATIFGAAGAALLKFLGGLSETILVFTLLVWTAGPIAIASRALRHRDL